MITLQGKFAEAKVFTDNVENTAISQIINLLNQEFVKDSRIRVMPDTHAGAGCTIGTTMTITDKIVPNLVGVDIGCGMETVMLKDKHVEVQALDKVIHEHIPAGFSIREQPHKYADEIELEQLHCFEEINYARATLSLGTLGGGNHFIEMDKDDSGHLYLVVHSGSRHLGKQIADYYQKAAYEFLREKQPDANKALSYLVGEMFNKYLHDMTIAQKYAELNRKAIVEIIMKKMKLKPVDSFTTIHNYIDMDSKILRKGAVSAQSGERILIPINMRDGSLICIGKGNEDWNFSAPHGAGRLMSRSEAKESITLSQFKKSMAGIYTTTVNQSTIDESPFAYKDMDEIVTNITDTADIESVIKPIYNFKSAE